MHTSPIPPRRDGIPNEDVWRLAEPATDFIQRDPHEGEAESERSEIRVLYDDEALYFGCMFCDSDTTRLSLVSHDGITKSNQTVHPFASIPIPIIQQRTSLRLMQGGEG